MFNKKNNEKSNVKFTEKDAKKAIAANKAQAEELLKDQNKMARFLKQVESKLLSVSAISDLISDIKLTISLIKAYVKKEYTEIPLGTILALVASLIYFLSPIDVIPDALPGIGYVDDAAVLSFALRLAHSDLEDYRKWLEKHDR